jgi:enoyl-CoA hydratase/carnithine racemase
MSGTYEFIIYEKADAVAWITLNRPDAMNAQSDGLRMELVDALEQASDDEEVFVVVITGSGDKAFSAGADVAQYVTRVPSYVVAQKYILRPFELIRNMTKPVIASVNGLALGAGCELMMSCDIIIAADDAKIGQTEIRVGLIPGGGGTQVLPRLVGEKKAKELIFTGRMITAQEAMDLGIINQVVPHEQLREATENLVKELLRNSPAIIGLAKIAINRSLETPLQVGMSYERDLFALAFSYEDQKEGAKAFLEKRKPSYKGK